MGNESGSRLVKYVVGHGMTDEPPKIGRVKVSFLCELGV